MGANKSPSNTQSLLPSTFIRVYSRTASLTGRGFLGRRAVLKQRVTEAPRSYARRRGLRPQLAGRNRLRRQEAIRQAKAFWADYRVALARFRDGATDVLFPAGTYWLRIYVGVRCAPAG